MKVERLTSKSLSRGWVSSVVRVTRKPNWDLPSEFTIWIMMDSSPMENSSRFRTLFENVTVKQNFCRFWRWWLDPILRIRSSNRLLTRPSGQLMLIKMEKLVLKSSAKLLEKVRLTRRWLWVCEDNLVNSVSNNLYSHIAFTQCCVSKVNCVIYFMIQIFRYLNKMMVLYLWWHLWLFSCLLGVT